MQRNSAIVTLLVLSLGCRTSAVTPMQRAPDEGFGELLRTLVTDSLIGGGRRSGQIYVAADEPSGTLLQAAGLTVAPRVDGAALACPASTDASGKPVAGTVGYIAHADRAGQGSGALRLNVRVSCSFVFHGGGRSFGQGGTWELRRDGDHWRIARSLERWIT